MPPERPQHPHSSKNGRSNNQDSNARYKSYPRSCENSDIEITNVSLQAHPDELVKRLQDCLHRFPYSRSKKDIINFRVFVLLNKGAGRAAEWSSHLGVAFLTLPNGQLTQRFLADYGPGGRLPMSLGGRRLSFKAGNRKASVGLIELLNRASFISPAEIRLAQRRQDRISENLHVGELAKLA